MDFNKDELSMFKLLLTIMGRAKASLSLLSISNVSTLKYAIKWEMKNYNKSSWYR